ncbi:MAG: hypothetical protein FJ095_17005 [Deltaproteobacteria bacterium]|nr:hypothetical protein [Deltaproteobacteria bacterium]
MRSRLLVLAATGALWGCSESETTTPSSSSTISSVASGATNTVATTTSATTSGGGGAGGSSGGGGESGGGGQSGGSSELPPAGGQALLDWLKAKSYVGWAAESHIHPSTGPHFGDVRVFLNGALKGSLEGQAAEHPAGSAAVKEFYGNGSTLLGWAVAIKLTADSDAGKSWHWYEHYNGSKLADGTGVSHCVNCHADGKDYVLIPFPLQ